MTKPKEVSMAIEPVSRALQGTLAEKVAAFDQMAASLAQLQLQGFDSVQKIKAACWLADGCGEHPATFIQGHWALLLKGRLSIEPRWEYMVRRLKETVPRFTFRVLIETDDCAKVEMSDGVDTHTVEYTIEDARRQGLAGRGGAWGENSREMLFKQAVKRAARRIGVGRQVPWVEVEMPQLDEPERDVKQEAERAVSGAVVVDEASGGGSTIVASQGGAERAVSTMQGAENSETVESAVAPKPAKVERPPIMRLSDALIVKYGKQTKAVMLEKAAFIYNEMVKANTGTNPGTTFKKVEDIGPVDAELMIEFLEHPPANGTSFGDPIVKAEDEPPPPDEAPPAEEAVEPADDAPYETFMLAIKRAKKLFGRTFIKEAPPASGKFWFIDAATFSQAGDAASIKVLEADGKVVAPQDKLRQLTKILVADCDAAERGR